MKRFRSERGEYEIAGFIFLLVVVLLVGLGVSLASNSHREHVTCTVQEKDRTRTDSGSDMRIYTEDCGVLKVGDSMLAGQWNSSDVYSSIKPGKRYEFTTTGWRIPLLSSFPNIIDVQEVP